MLTATATVRRPPAAGRGRKRGEANKITRDMRVVMQRFVEHNSDTAQEWIDRVAARNPARATALWLKACEFVLPRRSVNDGPTAIGINVSVGMPPGGTMSPEQAYQAMIAGTVDLDPAHPAFAPSEAIEATPVTAPPTPSAGDGPGGKS